MLNFSWLKSIFKTGLYFNFGLIFQKILIFYQKIYIYQSFVLVYTFCALFNNVFPIPKPYRCTSGVFKFLFFLFRFSIFLEFIFLYGVRFASNLIIFYIDVQFFQDPFIKLCIIFPFTNNALYQLSNSYMSGPFLGCLFYSFTCLSPVAIPWWFNYYKFIMSQDLRKHIPFFLQNWLGHH